jgi:ubiquitin-conjugating enzyme E2 Q
VGEVSDYVVAFSAALRKDLRQILDQGYRAGFHRVSELDNVVCVSVRVNQLGVDLRALQAWDSNLITGEIVYLVMLLNFGAKYPVDMDDMSRGQVRVKIGLSPKYKPDHKAIAAAFRNHSSAYTPGEFESFALSAPLDSLFAEKFQEIVACRRQYSVGWAAAEQHAFALGTKTGFDKKAAAKVDKEETKVTVSYKVSNSQVMGQLRGI